MCLTSIQDLLESANFFVNQVKPHEKAPVASNATTAKDASTAANEPIVSNAPIASILLHGPPGTGKTALAVRIAQQSEFPFIKFISPDNMVGYSEAQKVTAITQVFVDSYKSPLSVIIADNIERLIGQLAYINPQTFFYHDHRRLGPKGSEIFECCSSSVDCPLQQATSKGEQLIKFWPWIYHSFLF